MIYSLSFWERAGVRGEARDKSIFLFLLPSALTLTLSQGERERTR
jgi:hypothetical protein